MAFIRVNEVLRSYISVVKRLFVVILKPSQTYDRKLLFLNYFKIGSDRLNFISFLFNIKLHLQITIESNIVLSDTY